MMIKTSGSNSKADAPVNHLNNGCAPLLADAQGSIQIPTFVQQCDTLEKLKQHLLESSSSSCEDSDDNDSYVQEASLTSIDDMRKRLEARLDEIVAHSSSRQNMGSPSVE